VAESDVDVEAARGYVREVGWEFERSFALLIESLEAVARTLELKPEAVVELDQVVDVWRALRENVKAACRRLGVS
jgi:hypothetical protein